MYTQILEHLFCQIYYNTVMKFCLLFRLWEGFAQSSDGTVVIDVEVRPISYPFFPCNCTLTVLALLILCFTFLSKFPSSLSSLSYLIKSNFHHLCMSPMLCEYVLICVSVFQPVEVTDKMGERKPHQQNCGYSMTGINCYKFKIVNLEL